MERPFRVPCSTTRHGRRWVQAACSYVSEAAEHALDVRHAVRRDLGPEASTIAGETSIAITRAQTAAAATANVPVPAPKSITVLDASTRAPTKVVEVARRVDIRLAVVAGDVGRIEMLRSRGSGLHVHRPPAYWRAERV